MPQWQHRVYWYERAAFACQGNDRRELEQKGCDHGGFSAGDSFHIERRIKKGLEEQTRPLSSFSTGTVRLYPSAHEVLGRASAYESRVGAPSREAPPPPLSPAARGPSHEAQ